MWDELSSKEKEYIRRIREKQRRTQVSEYGRSLDKDQAAVLFNFGSGGFFIQAACPEALFKNAEYLFGFESGIGP